jgi:hypothetical protein
VVISLTSVHDEPFQASVKVTLTVVNPPNAKADVLSTPAAPKFLLAVFKSPTSVHDVPFQDSVIARLAVVVIPATANADVCVPNLHAKSVSCSV